MARAAPSGDRAWRALREALPTAIAQGVAGQKFLSDRWSTEMAWYHLGGVDRYAKALFPLVKKTLADGGKLDEAFLREAAALFPKK